MLCVMCQRELAVSEESTGVCFPCASKHGNSVAIKAMSEAAVANEMAQRRALAEKMASIILTTEAYPAGLKIGRRIEIITAECAFGMNIFRDFFAGMTDIFGGRSDSTQKILRDARRKVLQELRQEAFDVGANAVVGITLKRQINVICGGMWHCCRTF